VEPITHFLTGACIGRAGLNRKTAYATLAAVLAAEAADLDILWEFAGPVEGLKHHRGITHTFWAVPVVAGAAVGAVWLLDRTRSSWNSQHRGRKSSKREDPSIAGVLKGHGFSRAEEAQKDHGALAPEGRKENAPLAPSTRQPIRWGWLYLTCCIAALSHLLLDWTNNYGLRPFFPFNPRWYAGSFLFIAEPLLWVLFFLAFFMPWILSLADREIGARRKPFHGRGWAVFALAGMAALGCWRWAEHARAKTLLDNVQLTSEPVTRMAFEPYAINPFHWHAILETADLYQTAEIDTRTGSIESDPASDVMYKPSDTPAVEAAKRTPLGQAYLDWGSWAVVRDVGQEPIAGIDPPNLPPGRTWTTVEFTDLRFDYAFMPARSRSRAPLAGWVYLVGARDIGAPADRSSSVGWDTAAPADRSSSAGWEEAGEAMNGREQR